MNIKMSREAGFAYGGKKFIFASAAVMLLAAGCSSSQTADVGTTPQATDSGSQTAVQPTPTAMPTQQVQVQAQAQANNVSGAGDAVNLLVNDSTKEQSSVGTSDDSDVTNSDSSSLNSFTGVSNGY